jgi:hypothetical protein
MWIESADGYGFSRRVYIEVFKKIQDEFLREKEMYQDRLGELEGKSDKFVQKFNELLDFTDHADRVFQTSGLHKAYINEALF